MAGTVSTHKYSKNGLRHCPRKTKLSSSHRKRCRRAQAWQHIHLIPIFRRQRQVDPYELGTSLVYILSSRPARATEKDLVSKTKAKPHTWTQGHTLRTPGEASILAAQG